MSEATPEAPAQEQPSTTEPDASAEQSDKTDWQAEASRLREELTKARKWEQRAKENVEKAKSYDELKASQMTEQEKAVQAARDAARAEALQEAAPRLVAAEFRAAAVGRMTKEQLDGFLEDVDPKKYLTDSGEVDIERVAKKVELLAPAKEEAKAAPSFGGGPRKPEPPKAAGSLGEAIRNKIANPTR